MKKLIILVVIVLVAGLFAGCDFFDWLFPDEKLITITWFEDAERQHPDGSYHSAWTSDPNGPATLIQDDGGWCFADVNEVYNASGDLLDFSGTVFITETGVFSGHTAYYLYELETENIFVGQVEIIVYEDGTSGTMVGTYTQFKYAYAEDDEEIEILDSKYPKAIECVEDEGKWFVQYTDYITYPL